MEKHFLSYDELQQRAEIVCKEILSNNDLPGKVCIYGIPRGGVSAAILVNNFFDGKIESCLVHDIALADIIIDDIRDSGNTVTRYKKLNTSAKIYTLIDKLGKDSEYKNVWFVFPWESSDEHSVNDVPMRFIQYIGEDITREGLCGTPERVVKSWNELYSGYDVNINELFTMFEDCNNYDELILLKDCDLYSTCEHHLLPFYGKAHIAYIPNKKIVGISKLIRLMEVYSRRLQIQERIGQQVTSDLVKHLDCKAAACIIEARHLCLLARGVQKQHSTMTTSSLLGIFKEQSQRGIAARQELLTLIGNKE